MLSLTMTDARADQPPISGSLLELPDQVAALRPAVRALIAHLLHERRDHPDVDDAVSEVLRRALEGRARLRSGEPLRPWVLGIARHVALDALRQRRRLMARQPHGAAVPDSGRAGMLEHLASPEPDPERSAERRQRARRLHQAMGELSAEQRQALELFHLEGLAYREIAERLNVPVGTVGTWVMRGRRNLVAALDEREPER